jgi:hypothetical protein
VDNEEGAAVDRVVAVIDSAQPSNDDSVDDKELVDAFIQGIVKRDEIHDEENS